MKTFWLAPLLTLVSACAATGELPAQAAPAPAQQQPAAVVSTDIARPNQGASGLTPELMYHVLLAEVAGQRGQLDTAVEQYVEAARLTPDPAIAERATRIALYARDDERALAAAHLWAARAPHNGDVQQVIAALLLRKGKVDEAYRHVETALAETRPGEAELRTLMQMVGLLGQENDEQAVLGLMQRLVTDHPKDPNAWYARAHLAIAFEKLDTALGSVEHALALRPRWPDAQVLKATVLTQLGRDDEALKTLAHAVKLQPENSTLRLYYARKLVEEDRLADASAAFREVLKIEPGNPDAYYALGLLALQQKQLDEAETYFKKLVASGQRVEAAAYFLGQLAESRDHDDDALHWYSQVTDGQYALDARLRSAVLLGREGHLDQARELLAGIDAETAGAQLRVVLAEGEMLREAKRFKEAFDLYSEALDRMPANPDLLYARALTAEKLGRLDTLESDLKSILKQDPNNAQALNALGYTLADRTNRKKEALAYTTRAFELQPDDASILDSMGWVNYRLGHYDKALDFLRKAYAMFKDPEIGAHLGEVLWVSGHHDEARRVWSEALKEDPHHEILRATVERFTE